MNTRLLLLELHDDCRAAYAEALRAVGLDVRAVSDSQEALAMAPEIRPRLIVASFDGSTRDDRLQFCRELKRDRRTHKTAVLLTSGSLSEADLQLATEAGALVLSMAPRDSAKLLAAVARRYARRMISRVLRRRASTFEGCHQHKTPLLRNEFHVFEP